MRFLPGNAQHIGARHSQQDSFGFADPGDDAFIAHGGFLAVVCDGMGGMEHGDAASRTAVRVFLEAYGRKTPQESVPAALDRSVREANAHVVALSHTLGRVEGIGTTLIGATLLSAGPGQARLYWVSVGDSGLFHVGGGQMRMVNHPHVFANHLDAAVARGTISVEAAMSHPERDSLTSFIGAEALEEIDLTLEPMILADGDAILLASDGMFKTLAPAEIAECLQGHPQRWPDILVGQTLARRRESQDNVTVLSVSVEPERTVTPASATHALPAPYQEQGKIARTVALPVPVPEPPPGFGTAASLPVAAPPSNWPPPGISPAALPAMGPPVSPQAPAFQAPPPPSAQTPPASPSQPRALPTSQGMPVFQPPASGYAPPGYPPPPGHAVPSSGSQAAVQPSPAGISARPSRGSAWIWIVLALVFCIAAGGAGWFWFVHRPGDTARAIRSAEPAGQVKAPPRDPHEPIPPPDPRAPVESQPDAKPGIKEAAPR